MVPARIPAVRRWQAGDSMAAHSLPTICSHMQSIESKTSDNPRLAENRRNAAKCLGRHFPAETSDSYHGLVDAGKLVAGGHGLLIVVNHFSYRDGPGVFVYVAAQSDAMIDKPWLAPVARHISDVTRLINRVLGTQIDLKPVVTASTMNKPRFRHMHRGQGLRDYMISATETLQRGGIVALFPQATRMSYLPEPDEYDKAMEFLMKRTTKAGVNDFGILPVGFGVKGVEDYTELRGLNWDKTYEVNIGKLWLKNDVIQSAEDMQRSLDGWGMDQLKQLVPENYPKNPSSGDIFTAKKSK